MSLLTLFQILLDAAPVPYMPGRDPLAIIMVVIAFGIAAVVLVYELKRRIARKKGGEAPAQQEEKEDDRSGDGQG